MTLNEYNKFFYVIWGMPGGWKKRKQFFKKKKAVRFFEKQVLEGFSSASDEPYVLMVTFQDLKITKCRSYKLSDEGLEMVIKELLEEAKGGDRGIWESFAKAVGNCSDGAYAIEVSHLHVDYQR